MKPLIFLEKKESYRIFNEIAPRYDFLNHFLSGGLDIYWRKKFVRLLTTLTSRPTLQILDLATGTGDLAIEMAKTSQAKEVIGLDLAQEMITLGRKKVEKLKAKDEGGKGPCKVQFILGDGMQIPFPDNRFDAVTIAFGLRNFPDPLRGLQEMFRVLKPGGRIFILEFSLPTSPFWKKLYLFYFRNLLPIIGRLVSGHPDAYHYLNRTVEAFPYGKTFLSWPAQVGFQDLRFHPLTLGIATIYSGQKPH